MAMRSKINPLLPSVNVRFSLIVTLHASNTCLLALTYLLCDEGRVKKPGIEGFFGEPGYFFFQ